MEQVTHAVIAPWMQYGILGSVVVGLGAVCVLLWRALGESRTAHLAEVRSCHAQTLDLTLKKIDSDNRLADALEGVEKVMKAALDALKVR